ncbi:MAG: 1-(5-phosphoribosyl)-5-[(5-phosphoribosylamino)methylideneamino] imidazole-4-carboxamide isomerase [Acidobacteriota bacterium]|nr:1-(5-phosphoribosyl)-5-[(5-phosphoribosylamino)methylideneamino] imidazole-4-carboxamide isomerase [Acidobacteriota bacterium]
MSSGALEPIPAVDLSGGRVVRLLRGARERETVYGDDPLRTASEFAAAGARWLHVVDLDAAFGDGGNREAILRLLNESPLRVQVAGGVRTVESYAALRKAGAARVVFGTVAVEAPQVVEEAIRIDGAGVAVALDVRGGRLQTRGWVEPAGGAARASMSPEAAARHWGECGASAIVYTSVERDGTMEGPDAEAALRVAAASGLPTVVAGGVGALSHLRAVRTAAREHELTLGRPSMTGRLAGVILGRALYEGRFTLPEAQQALR